VGPWVITRRLARYAMLEPGADAQPVGRGEGDRRLDVERDRPAANRGVRCQPDGSSSLWPSGTARRWVRSGIRRVFGATPRVGRGAGEPARRAPRGRQGPPRARGRAERRTWLRARSARDGGVPPERGGPRGPPRVRHLSGIRPAQPLDRLSLEAESCRMSGDRGGHDQPGRRPEKQQRRLGASAPRRFRIVLAPRFEPVTAPLNPGGWKRNLCFSTFLNCIRNGYLTVLFRINTSPPGNT
jgi:hypothetical protein